MTVRDSMEKSGSFKYLSESSLEDGYRYLQELIRDFTKSKLFSWRNAQEKAVQILSVAANWNELRNYYLQVLPDNPVGRSLFLAEYSNYPECIAVFFHDVICEYLLDSKDYKFDEILESYMNVNLSPYRLRLKIGYEMGIPKQVQLYYGSSLLVNLYEQFSHSLDIKDLLRRINRTLALQGLQFILSNWGNGMFGIQMYRVEDFLAIQEKYTDDIDNFLSLMDFLFHLTGSDKYERLHQKSFTMITDGKEATLQIPTINFEQYTNLALDLRRIPRGTPPENWLSAIFEKYNIPPKAFATINAAWINLFSQDPPLLKKFYRSFRQLNA